MELDSWKKAWAHCRSCYCFPVSLKWNILVLFIIRCSIMNVWKLERAAVIYLQGIRGERAVLGKSERVTPLLECRKDPLVTRRWKKNPRFSFLTMFELTRIQTKHSSTISYVIVSILYARQLWNNAQPVVVTNDAYKADACSRAWTALPLIIFPTV